MFRVFFLLLLGAADGYKILIFSPTISKSHMISNGRIADELAKAGHDVVLFEPDFLNIFESVQAAKIAKRWPVRGFSDALQKAVSGYTNDLFEDTTLFSTILTDRVFHAAHNEMCKQIIENESLMEELKRENFDAYFGEHINLCGMGVAHALDIKIHFWISSSPILESMAMLTGMPTPLSYIPATAMTFSTSPSYFERVKNMIYGAAGFLTAMYDHYRTTQIFRDKYGSDFPSVGEIAGNSDIVFVSTDEFVEIPRPIMPNMVNIGGLGLGGKRADLPREFTDDVDLDAEGIIFFSLGTVVNTTLLPTSVMENLAKIAEELPQYHLIARVDAYDLHAKNISSRVPNFSVHDWVPQVPLLNHPKMRLFITHSGYNGIMEAARAGVPLLTVPFMFDQHRNSLSVALKGWGLPIHRKSLQNDPQLLIESIQELLFDYRYKESALRIARLIQEKPFNASERLVKTVEFVLKNGGVKELLAEGRKQSFIHHNNLDILVPFAFIFVFSIYGFYRFYQNISISSSSLKSKLE